MYTNRRLLTATGLVAGLLMATGCAGPSVSYVRADKLPQPADTTNMGKDEVAKRISDGGTLISLAKTRLMFDLAPPKPAAGTKEKAEEGGKSKLPEEVITEIDYASQLYRAVGVQAPADGPYLVRPHKSWFEESKLSVTKYPQTNLPAVVKFNYTDKTPQRIEQVGKVLLTLVSIAAAGVAAAPDTTSPEPLKPFVIDIEKPVTKAPLPGHGQTWTYTVAFDDAALKTQQDVFSRTKFEQLTANEDKVGFYPVPACREAQVTLERSNSPQIALRMKVGTPEYLKLVPLQMETVITIKELCDATVDSKDYEALDAYLARAKAVMDAVDAVKKKADETEEKLKKEGKK